MAFARKVNVTMFILMKTVMFICRGGHEGIANLEAYRDIQGQTGIDRDHPNYRRKAKRLSPWLVILAAPLHSTCWMNAFEGSK